MTYRNGTGHSRPSKMTVALIALLAMALVVVLAAVGVRIWYENQLEPVSSSTRIAVVEIPQGSSVQEIADILSAENLIKSPEAFKFYIRNNSLTESLKAGTYELDAAKSTPEIVNIITDGAIQETLFTILPGQRLSQIRQDLLEFGYSATEVDSALQASNYQNHPALVAKPSGANLEGYLYPESFRTDSSVTVEDIITKSLDEMADVVTPELIQAWQDQGLGIHQAVILASIIENEVSSYEDRRKAAQVFLKRLNEGIKLQSNATDNYPPNYDTYSIFGLPPGPITNVTETALQAVAFPSPTDYLYFVSGKDCITRFSQQLAQHEALIAEFGVAAPSDNCR